MHLLGDEKLSTTYLNYIQHFVIACHTNKEGKNLLSVKKSNKCVETISSASVHFATEQKFLSKTRAVLPVPSQLLVCRKGDL